MRQRWRVAPWALAALVAALALGGCGAKAVGPASTTAPSPTITLIPTATDGPQLIALYPGCPLSPLPAQPRYVAVGGLEVSVPQRLDDTPSALMPNGEPNAPYRVSLTPDELQVGAFHPDPAVNPLGAGYAIQICNQTSAPHTLNGVSVIIASFSASSGPVTVWHICQDGPYDAATEATTPGCGGGFAGNLLTATLGSSAVGATAPATGAIWPVTIAPNQSVSLVIVAQGLTSQGTYTLNFGVNVDGAAATPIAPSDGSFLIAPNATIWTGTACESAAMKAQIPAATTDTYYVCPPIR